MAECLKDRSRTDAAAEECIDLLSVGCRISSRLNMAIACAYLHQQLAGIDDFGEFMSTLCFCVQF